MSVISALERIERWAAQNDPQFVSLLQPGLTQQEIDALVGGLPFALAEEVYDLYQWHNGQSYGEFRLGLCKTNQYRFLPLAEAVQEWDRYLGESYRDEVEQDNPIAAQIGGWPAGDPVVLQADGWLPLFEMDSDFKVSLGARAESQTAPIAYVPHDDHSAIFYESLTAMLNYTADVYESGALRSDDEMGDFFDYTITSAISRRHFPNKVVVAEAAYRQGRNLSSRPRNQRVNRPQKEEFEQYALVSKLIQSGSQEAIPAVQAFLLWLLGDADQARQVTQDLVNSPYLVMREWPHSRSLLTHNLTYSFLSL